MDLLPVRQSSKFRFAWQAGKEICSFQIYFRYCCAIASVAVSTVVMSRQWHYTNQTALTFVLYSLYGI